MGFLDTKPYTAVSETIERLTRDEYEEDDISELPELIDIILIRPTGPTEAARALRKKLKYGTAHKQLRALALFDALLQNGNAGDFKMFYQDEMLLERLRVLATDSFTDKVVKERCKELFFTWHQQFGDDRHYNAVASLYRSFPRKARKPRKYTYEDDHADNGNEYGNDRHADAGSYDDGDDDDERPHTYSNSSARVVGAASSRENRDRDREEDERFARVEAAKERERQREKERKKKAAAASRSSRSRSGSSAAAPVKLDKTELKVLLADASGAATNLTNCLQRLNREIELSTENAETTKAFNECRALRKKILRLIHGVSGDEYLGALIHANEELIEALKLYDDYSRHPGEDSDSDYENDDWMQSNSDLQRLNLGSQSPRSPRSPMLPASPKSPKPPRPAKPSYLISQMRSPRQEVGEEEEDNPFGDANATN